MVGIKEAMTILCSIKGQMCKEKKVTSPTKNELMLGLEKLIHRTPKAEQAAELGSWQEHLTALVAKQLFPDLPASVGSANLLAPDLSTSADLLAN